MVRLKCVIPLFHWYVRGKTAPYVLEVPGPRKQFLVSIEVLSLFYKGNNKGYIKGGPTNYFFRTVSNKTIQGEQHTGTRNEIYQEVSRLMATREYQWMEVLKKKHKTTETITGPSRTKVGRTERTGSNLIKCMDAIYSNDR